MKVLFNKNYRIGRIEDGEESEYDCGYIENNIRSTKKLKDRDLWKTSGFGARFRGDSGLTEQDAPLEISLSGLAGFAGNKVFYVANVNDMSALYLKDLSDPDPGAEQHLLHGCARKLKSADYDRGRHSVVFASSEDDLTYHVTLLNLATGEDRTLTDGDIVADNPSFAGQHILFNCYLVGRDENGNFAGYSAGRLFELDPDTLEVSEIKGDDKFNYVCPKADDSGNLYYLIRPASKKRRKSNLFLDIILFPYRILKAFVNFLNFFSVSYGGGNLRSEGNNPAKTIQKSEKELFIEGNRIDAAKNLRANARKGCKYPGVVPQTWQLVRCAPDGTETVLAKGVLAYDVDGAGRIAYSNGKHLFALENGQESYLAACGLSTVVKITDR